MYLYQKTLCRLRVAILKWQEERKGVTGRAEERQGEKRTVSCVTRHATGANESGNLIPTCAGKPTAGRMCCAPSNFAATGLFIDKQQVMEDSF